MATLPRLSIPSCRADGRLHRHGQAVTLLRLFPSTAATLDFHRRVLPVLPGAVLSRHLNTSQRAVAEAKRAKLDAEYGAIVVKMKAEARGRKQLDRDSKGRVKPSGKQISPTDKEAAKTTTTRARAAGTNRRLGEMLAEGPKNPGTRMAGKTKGNIGGTVLEPPIIPTLASLGIDKDSKAARDKRIFDLWLACWTQAEIAAEVSAPQKTVDDVLAKMAGLPDSLKPAADHLTDFDPPIYNIWKQQEKTAGSSHFGNSEICLLDNLLYLYTNGTDAEDGE